MKKPLTIFLLISLMLTLMPLVHASDERKDALTERKIGFQYPLDSGGGYTVGWVSNFDLGIIESDFQKIHTNFPSVNFLRMPIDYFDMKWSFISGRIQAVVDLAEEYGFKVMIVLFNRLGGSGGYLTPQYYLPERWDEQEEWLENTIRPLATEKNIYAWALENEANVFQAVTLAWFHHFIPIIKSIDFHHPVSTSFYALGFNSTTISRYKDLVDMGLDFVEYHYYPTDTDDITKFCNDLVSYVECPLFLTEFGTYNGLSTYNTTTNNRILRDIITTFEARLNVIGLAYYRWSNDIDAWTIWDYASQTPKPEATTLNTYMPMFLGDKPYAYLSQITATNTESVSISDSSFEKLTEWPDSDGWVSWNNHTRYDVTNASTSEHAIQDPTTISISNNGFEGGYSDWSWQGSGGEYSIVSNYTKSGDNSLLMWNTVFTADLQSQHSPILVSPRYAYILDGWIAVSSQSGGAYAFIQIAYRNSYGAWIRWNESAYINYTTSWIHVYAVSIAPYNAYDMLVNCRIRGNLGYISAYFDELKLIKIAPVSYDGLSNMVAYARGLDEPWSACQLAQNYTFPNPTEDTQKIWTFSVKLANVQSQEYWTDWKGIHVQMAFTTDNSSEWISWADGQYVSFSCGWVDLNVSARPPSNAKGLQMIIKVAHSEYGVFYVDMASLSSRYVVTPTNYTMPENRSELRSLYNITLRIEANNNTNYTGIVYGGYGMEIMNCNVTFNQTSFWSLFNETYQNVFLQFGEGALEMWMPIMLILGLVGLTIVVLMPTVIIYEMKKKRNYGFMVTGFFIWMIALCLVIGWLWG